MNNLYLVVWFCFCTRYSVVVLIIGVQVSSIVSVVQKWFETLLLLVRSIKSRKKWQFFFFFFFYHWRVSIRSHSCPIRFVIEHKLYTVPAQKVRGIHQTCSAYNDNKMFSQCVLMTKKSICTDSSFLWRGCKSGIHSCHGLITSNITRT